MRSKEVTFALLCAFAGVFVVFALTLLGDRLPSPVVYFTGAIVVLGTALVLVRYDRLGPFQGEFGPPGHESTVRDLIVRESQRALRYGGEFAVLVVRFPKGVAPRWHRVIRASDTVVPCRRGQSIVVLPEMTREGATQLASRLDAAAGASVSLALIHFPGDDIAEEELCPALLQLVRQASSASHLEHPHVSSSGELARPFRNA